jgi:hypothetical protein
MANTVIQLKRSAATGNTPVYTEIDYGELALNYADGKLYYRTALDTVSSIFTPNLYETVNVNGTLLIPTSTTEILSFKPKNSITLTANTTTDTIEIGETLTGNVVLNTGGTITGDLTVEGSTKSKDAEVYSSNTTVATVSQTTIDSFTASSFRTARYLVQITDGTKHHSTEFMLVHNGTNVNAIEYATVTTDGELGTFTADINTGLVRLRFTASDTNSRTIKYFRTLIKT